MQVSKYLDDTYMIHKYSPESQSKGKVKANRRRRGIEEAMRYICQDALAECHVFQKSTREYNTLVDAGAQKENYHIPLYNPNTGPPSSFEFNPGQPNGLEIALIMSSNHHILHSKRFSSPRDVQNLHDPRLYDR